MAATIFAMAKKPSETAKDRHKKSIQVRIPIVFKVPLERLAEINGGELPDEVRTAVREYLQRHELWPKAVEPRG